MTLIAVARLLLGTLSLVGIHVGVGPQGVTAAETGGE
jgi:hypothetical protein